MERNEETTKKEQTIASDAAFNFFKIVVFRKVRNHEGFSQVGNARKKKNC